MADRDQLAAELARLDEQLRPRSGKASSRLPSGCLFVLVGVVSLLALIVFGISLDDLANETADAPAQGGAVLPAVSFAVFAVTVYPSVQLYRRSISKVPLKQRPVLKARRREVRAELARSEAEH